MRSLRRAIWRVVRLAAHAPLTAPFVVGFYERKALEPAWRRVHPFDRDRGVDTSGFLPGNLLARGSSGYGAAQPSIVRSALAAIPDRGSCHFVDAGCGKGRPLIVAAEAGFAKITGVEYTPELARIGRRNAAILARARPDLPRISIVTGDVLAFALPDEPLVIFLYNPFDRTITARLLRRIEASLAASPRELYVVSYNPTWADVFDGSGVLERRYAAHVPYDDDEAGYGPNDSDTVVIWQNRGNPHPLLPGRRDAVVRVVTPGVRAVLAAGP